MRAQGSGWIIDIASTAGLVPLRLQCAFVAAKAGMVNLTRGMAIELGPTASWSTRSPPARPSPGTRQLFQGERGLFRDSVQQMLAHIPLGRPAETKAFAVAALFRTDPENRSMNGHILTVDGGGTAGSTREF